MRADKVLTYANLAATKFALNFPHPPPPPTGSTLWGTLEEIGTLTASTAWKGHDGLCRETTMPTLLN